MTSGQFELVRAKTADNLRAQSGLELNVIDHYNGSIRSVKSLSGGESFKASLAMALGLSDEIQSQTGGIQIDTMFIDEGFGSLDENSLEQAIDVLLRLSESNRLAGNHLPRRRIKGAYRAADCCYQDTGRRKPCQDCYGQLRTAVYFTASYKP